VPDPHPTLPPTRTPPAILDDRAPRSTTWGSSGRWMILGAALGAAGCGGGVQALDPKDTALPEETRQWIADAEDGVIAARARLSSARAELALVEAWADTARSVEWEQEAPKRALEQLAEARVELARRDVTYAESVLELSLRKYELANAERAVLHDLATYELEPLRLRTDAARDAAGKAREEYNKQRDTVQEATDAWWTAYASYVQGGGDTMAWWTAGAEAFTVLPPEAYEDDELSEDPGPPDGDAADGDAPEDAGEAGAEDVDEDAETDADAASSAD